MPNNTLGQGQLPPQAAPGALPGVRPSTLVAEALLGSAIPAGVVPVDSGTNTSSGGALQSGGLLALTAGQTITLTAQQAQNNILVVTGAGNTLIQVPNTPGLQFTISNLSTGTVTVQPIGGSGFGIPSNTVTQGYVDNTSTFQAAA